MTDLEIMTHSHDDLDLHDHEHDHDGDLSVEDLEELHQNNIKELQLAVRQATAINDARLNVLEKVLKIVPDALQLLDIKVTLLAEQLFANAEIDARLMFEWNYQKRLEAHLNSVEELAKLEIDAKLDAKSSEPKE